MNTKKNHYVVLNSGHILFDNILDAQNFYSENSYAVLIAGTDSKPLLITKNGTVESMPDIETALEVADKLMDFKFN